MGSIFSSQKSKEEREMALNKAKETASSAPVVVFRVQTALNKAKETTASAPVVVFSKTYCGYCKRVKDLLNQLSAAYKVIELDEESDGGDIQAALAEWTGQRTVPNVFIAGKHIGGCDSVFAKYQAGQLTSLLTDAGAIANNSAQL